MNLRFGHAWNKKQLICSILEYIRLRTRGVMMPNVFAIAERILEKTGTVTAMKLQKLVYYSQAWSLVWDEAHLFEERIEAWANGPVVRDLYSAHRLQFEVCPGQFAALANGSFSTEQVETIDEVLEYYGDKSSQWLSDLTHMEDPWRLARKGAGLADGERGEVIISQAAMAEYYSSLQ